MEQLESGQAPLSARLVCSEVRGGNVPVDANVHLPGILGSIYSRPCAGGRGGDIHYLSVCDAGLVSQMLIADVMGHGEAVAAVSEEVYRLLHRYLNRIDQRRVLRQLNRRLEAIGFDALTTAIAVSYLPLFHRLSVSNAGHPVAWFYRHAKRTWTPLDAGASSGRHSKPYNLPLAAHENTAFTRRTVRVAHRDRLFVLTDGVLETVNEAGELFGADRIARQLNGHASENPHRLISIVREALVEHAGAVGLTHDDITMLMVEFVPSPRGPVFWNALRKPVRVIKRRMRPDAAAEDRALTGTSG